jgi:hypothetical protein
VIILHDLFACCIDLVVDENNLDIRSFPALEKIDQRIDETQILGARWLDFVCESHLSLLPNQMLGFKNDDLDEDDK